MATSEEKLINNEDVLRLIAEKLPAKSIINLCRSKKSVNIRLCKNTYFLKQITRRYFTRNPERLHPYNDILSQLAKYDKLENDEDLLDFAILNGYDEIIYSLINEKKMELKAVDFNKLLSSLTVEEKDLLYFYKHLDYDSVDEDRLRRISDSAIKNKYYKLLESVIKDNFDNAPYYDITETIWAAVMHEDIKALKIILDEYGADQGMELDSIYQLIIMEHPDMIDIFIEYGFDLPNNLIYLIVKSRKLDDNRFKYFMKIWEQTQPDNDIIMETLVEAINSHDAHKDPNINWYTKKMRAENPPINNLEIIEFLSSKIDTNNELIIDEVAYNSDLSIVKILVDKGFIVTKDLLIKAAENENNKLLEYLIANYKFDTNIIQKARDILKERNEFGRVDVGVDDYHLRKEYLDDESDDESD